MSDFLKRIAEFSPKRLMLLAAELEERVRVLEARNRAPIAIIGMGCRFPGGVRNPETYWELLSQGRDAITEVPSWRWDISALYDPDPHSSGRVSTRWGGFLESPELFDPAFFGIAPVEARGMDPQQRLLLEVGWEALEDAAIVPATLAGSRTGVFVGLCNSDYAQRTLQRNPDRIDAYFAQGASHAVAAGRISYFLGLRGPSVAIDTACSSSLVAIHQACQSLRTGETDLVLAGGVNLIFIPEVTMALSRAQMMAPDGRCKAFSAAANGFVRSEGCGLVVLKRLDDALQDGDRVMAVIRGTAANQDGRSSGITAPNGPSQEDVIRAALADAGLSAEAVSYVEAHGTGTSLGDLIELRALETVLGKGRSPDTRLPVGSVKTNFGHTESAAGVAGLIKLALSLQHRAIPASLHCAHPNPEIDWESNHLRVPPATESWQPAAGQAIRIGAVSSFGFSGTNAHLVVTEPPAGATVSVESKGAPVSYVVPLSARSERALRIMAAQLADRLRDDPALPLQDVAFTLATGRSVFVHRAAIRVDSKERLIEELSLLAQGDSDQDSAFFRGVEARKPRVAFLFAGQGGERTGMGLSLLAQSEVFRAAVAEVDAALAGAIATPIEDIFRNQHDELKQSALVQPALYAFQYGLARVWQSWGIEPEIVVGHSMGEIVACTLAGVMSVADASLLVAARGRLTQQLGDPGGMVALTASEDQALAGLAAYEADVSIAAVNGPASVVISGRSQPLEQATLGFERAGFRVKRLNITYGSHSPAMHRVLPAFYQEAAKVQYHASRIPILADLTGEMATGTTTFNAQYFTSHLSRPVQFQRCLDRLAKEGCGLCIEMGPRAVLSTFGKERAELATSWIASATGREDDYLALQSAVAEAFTGGATLDWNAIFGHRRRNKVSLPTYPFERERYWIAEEDFVPQAPAPRTTRRLESAIHGSAGWQLDASVPIFERELAWPLPWHLADHRVGKHVVVPASVYLSLAWDAFRAHGKTSLPARILNLTINLPLQPDDESLYVQTVLTPFQQNGSFTFHISSRRSSEEPWTLHATGQIDNGASLAGETTSTTSFDREAAGPLRGEEFYQLLEGRGVHLGAAFRAIKKLWCLPGAAQGLVVSDRGFHGQPDASAGPHPALLDACFQVLGAAALDGGDTQLRLMTGIEEIVLCGELHGEMSVEAQLKTLDAGIYEGSLLVRDQEGTVLARVRGIRLRPVTAQWDTAHSGEGWLYEQAWQPAALKGESSYAKSRHWLVIGSRTGLAGAVVDRLLSAGHSAVVVSSLDELDFVRATPLPHEIVDLRAIDSFDRLPTGLSVLPVDSAESIGEAAVALTVQSLRLWQNLLRDEGKLWLFTQGALPIHGTSHIGGAMQSTLWGLARCATLEHPQRLRRVVDFDPGATFQQISAVVVRELLSKDDEEQVAYTGNSRLAFRLQPSECRNPAPVDDREIFHEDGSYLLTGGLGGLGLRLSAWLGKQAAGKLVLLTRSLASVTARQQEIEALRAAGVDLTVVQADVADAAAMQQLLARFGDKGDLPPLRGIFHMAADICAAPVEAIDSEQIRSTFRAKISGTWNLHQLTRTLPLDFFVCFSSTAAILGAGSLGTYAAANSFVESMTAIRAAEGLPFISINWGTWQTMRLASREAQSRYASGGMLPMPDDAALEWLKYLLRRGDMRQPMVANIDWTILASLYEAQRQRHWMQFVRPHTPLPGLGTKSAWSAQPGETRLNSLERAVQKEAARILGFRRGEVPPVDVRLVDLGLDSLMAVSLRNRLQQLIGHALSAAFAFEYATPARMAMALDMILWGAGEADEEHSAAERDEIHL